MTASQGREAWTLFDPEGVPCDERAAQGHDRNGRKRMQQADDGEAKRVLAERPRQ
jgi:hypothetical protein